MLAAMPSTFEHGAVVVEANAVRHSPVGQLLVDCFVSRDGGRMLDRFRNEIGINPLEDVDRVAVVDESVIVSGHFGAADWKKMFETDGVPHGPNGTIYGDGDDAFFGVWNGQIVVAAESKDQVRAALDRLDGKGGDAPAPFDDSLSYGEIYGVLSPTRFADALPSDQAELAARIRAAAARVELHVDTTRDVGIVADVTGPQSRETEELGKALGAALALGRLQAKAQGENDLVELMDLARVVPEDGQFRLEMGLPLEVMEKHLRECVRRNEERREKMGTGIISPGNPPK